LRRQDIKKHYDLKPLIKEQRKQMRTDALTELIQKYTSDIKNGLGSINTALTLFETLSDEAMACQKLGKISATDRFILYGELLTAVKIAIIKKGYQWGEWASTNIPNLTPRTRQALMQLASIPHAIDFTYLGKDSILLLDSNKMKQLYPRDIFSNPILTFFKESGFPFMVAMTFKEFQQKLKIHIFWVESKRAGLVVDLLLIKNLVIHNVELGDKLIKDLLHTKLVNGDVHLHIKNIITRKCSTPK